MNYRMTPLRRYRREGRFNESDRSGIVEEGSDAFDYCLDNYVSGESPTMRISTSRHI